MKKALIKDTRICQVTDEVFPVHPSLQWVDVLDDTTERDTYVNGAVVKYAPPVVVVDPRRVLDEAECEAAKIDGQIISFLNMSPAQLDTWVDTNITGTGPRTAFKILGRLAQTAARGKTLR